MIFPKLNIFGFNKAQETCILASMLCGEPCLLIGPPGTAKTELVNAIGAALREDSKATHPNNPAKWFSYQVYDASKINFEDLFGYPDINGLKLDPPVVRYISTPSSIWGKDLIAFDELNRCAEDRQSNLFEIIRSRKLHGTPTGNAFIFSTMNPFGDQGTVEMSDALVDRHLFYLRLDGFAGMDSQDRKKVIKRVGQVDGVGFRYWGDVKGDLDVDDKSVNQKLASVGREIRNLFTQAMKHYEGVNNSLSSSVTHLIDKLVDSFSRQFSKESEAVKKECSISGRRAASILRGVLAVRAIQYATLQENEEMEDIMGTLMNTIKLCMPIGIGGKLNQDIASKADALVEDTVKTFWPQIKQGKDVLDIDRIQQAVTTSNPIKILDTLLNIDTNEITRTAIFNNLLDKEKYKSKTSNTGNYSVDNTSYSNVHVLLYKIAKEIPNFVPQSIALNISPELVEEVSNKVETTIGPVFRPYIDIIQTIIKKQEDNPLTYFAMKTALFYYKDRVANDADAIKTIVEMRNLAESIRTKIEYHKNAKAES